MEKESVLNMDGLTEESQLQIKFLYDFVTEHPKDANAFIAMHELQPFEDSFDKAKQMLLISSMVGDPAIIDKRISKVTEERNLTGFGAIMEAVGGLFGQQEGGTRMGNFWRKLTGQELPENMTEADKLILAKAMADAEEEEKKKEEEEKKLKERNAWIIGITLFVIILVITLAVVYGGKKKAA